MSLPPLENMLVDLANTEGGKAFFSFLAPFLTDWSDHQLFYRQRVDVRARYDRDIWSGRIIHIPEDVQ